MDKTLQKTILLRSGIHWGIAIIGPSIVMVVLDLFDKHTPTNIAWLSGTFLMAVYILHNAYLSKALESILGSGEDE